MSETETALISRPPGAIRHSIYATAVGYSFSVLLTEFLWHSRFGHYFGTLLAPWIANVSNAALSFLGWLLVILPLSIFHRPGKWSDRIPVTCVIAAAIGYVITALATLPLAGYNPGVLTMREFYITAGILNACTATVCLIALRRTAAMRSNHPL